LLDCIKPRLCAGPQQVCLPSKSAGATETKEAAYRPNSDTRSHELGHESLGLINRGARSQPPALTGRFQRRPQILQLLGPSRLANRRLLRPATRRQLSLEEAALADAASDGMIPPVRTRAHRRGLRILTAQDPISNARKSADDLRFAGLGFSTEKFASSREPGHQRGRAFRLGD
jgi:hypothetical protein